MAKQLTARQAKFCANYMEGKSAYQSAIESGFSESTAKNATAVLVKNKEIEKHIKKAEADLIKASGWNKSRIISELERIYMLAVNDDQLSNAQKTLELIAKLTNSMPTASNTTVNHNVRFEKLLASAVPVLPADQPPKIIN